jgi:nucleoside permease NupC
VTELAPRAVSALGFVAWMAVAWALSEDRRAAPWRTVVWGIALQLGWVCCCSRRRSAAASSR